MGMPSIWMQKSSNFGIKPATMRGIFMRIFPGFKGTIRVWKWDIPARHCDSSKSGWVYPNKIGNSRTNTAVLRKIEPQIRHNVLYKISEFYGPPISAPHAECVPLLPASCIRGRLSTKTTIWSVAISLTLQGSSPNPAIAIWGYQVTQTFARWPGFHPYKSSKFGESSELEPGPLRGGSRSFWTSHFCIQFFTHQIPGKENMNKEVDVGNCTKKYFLNFTQKPTETIPTCILLWTSGLQPLVTKRDNSN
jgi:hypothetical protein